MHLRIYVSDWVFRMADNLIAGLCNLRSLGLYPSSLQALIISAVFKRHKKVVLWIVEDADEMYKAVDDLACFMDKDCIRMFHAPDVRPYQDDSPSKEIVAQRISVLYSLLESGSFVVVAPLPALVGFTIPPVELVENSIKLLPDMDIDRDALSMSMVRMGYTREALIDDVGQFSIRGSVMDIYSPGMKAPLRIDMFGDTITDIKTFDPITQRSKKNVNLCLILPASEVLLKDECIKRARPVMKLIKGKNIRYVINDIEQGIHVPGIESFVGLFYDNASIFFDYLPEGSMIAGPDKQSIEGIWNDLKSSFRHEYERAMKNERGFPEPDSSVVGIETLIDEIYGSDHISTSVGSGMEGLSYKEPPANISVQQDTDIVFDYISSLNDRNMDVYIYMSAGLLMERVSFALDRRGIDVENQAESSSILLHHGWRGKVLISQGAVSSGFELPEMGIAVISGDQVFGSKKRKKRATNTEALYNPFAQLNPGDAVVHRDNGIGVFKGVVRMELNNVKSDFILLEYLGGDKLYIPVYRLSLLQRYIGEQENFIIDKLGGTRWSKAKTKAKESVAKIANDLLAIYAKRQSAKGFSFDTANSSIQEFEDSFPYDETDDQLKAIEDVYADMASNRSMDRLVCGDVGYGKTEVAMRAAFAAVMSGKQVAILVPTTLLARQHMNTFRERMDRWPIKVEALSSFSKSAYNKSVLEDLASGKVDVMIGTHALLSDNVSFRDLGLLIVDEEHRFGVKHKEMIKSMRSELEIITLTATPIPRTLNMAISGIRDLSVIETPPAERKSIETDISRFDEEIIKESIYKELNRGGQVFFVHNQVSTIDTMAAYIGGLCPDARVAVSHGQMPRTRLNTVMAEFLDRKKNVLVTSSIISSGIDIHSANTIIINRADRFGLADLYQLRGRVGRSKVKGYALLLIPEVGRITKDAHKRLSALKEYESLGAGFQMAMRDMEIRGVGDILGKAQWGHVSAIGYELYQQMLKEAVDTLEGKETAVEIDPEIKIGIDAYIPDDYCPDQHLRLGLYKRLFSSGPDELASIGEELTDLYGPIPDPLKVLIHIAEIREIMKRLRMKKLERSNNRLRLYMARDTMIDLGKLIDKVTKRYGRMYPEGIAEIPIGENDVTNEIRDILYSIA